MGRVLSSILMVSMHSNFEGHLSQEMVLLFFSHPQSQGWPKKEHKIWHIFKKMLSNSELFMIIPGSKQLTIHIHISAR